MTRWLPPLRKFALPLVLLAQAGVSWAEQYDPRTQILFMERVSVGGQVFTNVNVRLIDFDLLELSATPIPSNVFDPATNILHLNHVKIVGGGDFYWLRVLIKRIDIL